MIFEGFGHKAGGYPYLGITGSLKCDKATAVRKLVLNPKQFRDP